MLDLHSPCVVVVSDYTNPASIVKQILKCDDLPEPVCLGENIKGYSWEIDTKYYKACVNICPLKNDDVLPEILCNSTEGLILYFDSKNAESFEKVKKWSDSMKEDPEILLLICDTFEDIGANGVSKSVALNWCLENGYELIELQDTDTEGQEYNDIIPDQKGADRIIEALQAHTWSNLEMKATSKSNGTHPSDLNLEGDNADFTELFSQLQSMKESIQSLPARDRRNCAEQVVATFWKAIGGDEDEIDDILP